MIVLREGREAGWVFIVGDQERKGNAEIVENDCAEYSPGLAIFEKRYHKKANGGMVLMTTKARKLLASFDTLPPDDQREIVAEILRRTVPEGEIPDAALDELAIELFRGYDAEEAARDQS